MAANPSNPDQPIDRQALWGDVQDQLKKRAAQRDNLGMLMAHKSLNIPLQEDMQINSTTRNGLGWKELLVMLLFAGGIAAATYCLAPQANPTPEQPPASTEPPTTPQSLLYNLDIEGK
jgi:hypothetical protein